MRTPGNGVARNTAYNQQWLNLEKAVLSWSECDEMIRFRFDPGVEIAYLPDTGIYCEVEAFLASPDGGAK